MAGVTCASEVTPGWWVVGREKGKGGAWGWGSKGVRKGVGGGGGARSYV